MINLIEEGTISGKMAKDIVEDMYHTGKPPQDIIREKGLKVQITDEGGVTETIKAIIDAHVQLADYRGGREKLFGFVGQVMKATQGKANPQLT